MSTITSDLVTNHNDVPITTSLKVAEVFGKRHDDVLKSIRNLTSTGKFQSRNFAELTREYQGRQFPYYLMDRRGFTVLAMGFTGDNALDFKLQYVDQFDRMEAHIRQNQMVAIPNFNNPVEAARAWADQMEKRQALESQNAVMLPKAKCYDQFMDVDGTLNLTHAAKALGFTSGRALGMYLRETWGRLFKDTTNRCCPGSCDGRRSF
jgi:Rha family phage regulatory protein